MPILLLMTGGQAMNSVHFGFLRSGQVTPPLGTISQGAFPTPSFFLHNSAFLPPCSSALPVASQGGGLA